MKIPLKQAFLKHFQRQFSLRLHMSAILLATTLSGVLFSKVLLVLGVVDFRIRYPLSVLFSYLVFFVSIRLWLSCIASANRAKASAIDWLDLPGPSPRSVGGNFFRGGGGGQFSGAGASGSFEKPDMAFVETSVAADPLPTHGGSAPEAVGDAVSGAAEALGDDNILAVVIVLVVLVATILVSTVFLLYGAPAILAEAAFEGILAASLIKRTRAISDKAWAGSILKATWKPFALAMGVAILAGLVLHSFYPDAIKLADIFVES
jgi:hypothetical protein